MSTSVCFSSVMFMCICLNVATDVSVSGSRWNVVASPSLAHLIQRSAQDVPHPTDPNKTLWDAHFDVGPYEGSMDPLFARMWDEKTSNQPGIGPMGSGSDYTVFLHRLGVGLSSSALTGALKASSRSQARTRASGLLRQTRHSTTTLSMTRRCGKRYMQTPVSANMYVFIHLPLHSSISPVTRLLSRIIWVC